MEPQTPETVTATRRTQHITQQRLQYPQGSQDQRYYASAQRSGADQFEIQESQVRMSMDQLIRTKEFTPRKITNYQRKEYTEQKARQPAYQFQEKAIPLVIVSGSGKFELNQEVVQMMEHVKGPIGVVAVAGMYRTGKSYLLNRLLLNRKRGFNVGPTINPCTKGIWIWGTPLKSFTSTGEPCSVLIVDSEGIGGLDEDNNHDMRIFSLALLLSSYFIYNSMSQIDENALQNLSLVVNLTKHIQTQAGTGLDQESGADLDAYLPTFMWVIRDFALQLEDETGKMITDKEYLELALEQKGSSKTEAKNQIRAALLRHFKRRDCCTMIRPLVNEEQLQRLEEMDIEELRGEFVEQVVNLRKKVLGKIPVKKMKGTPMDGQTWVGLLKLYTQAFNEDRIPNVDSSWSYICRQRAEQNLMKATEHFESTLLELQVPMNHDELQSCLDESRITSIQVFEQSLLEPTIAQDVLQRLEEWVKDRTQELMQQNEQACCEYAESMLSQLFGEIVEQLRTMNHEPQFYQHVDYELGRLSQFYEATCYNFPEKRLYLMEAKYSFLNDMLAEQVRFYQQEMRHQSDLELQAKDRLHAQLQSLKDDHTQKQHQLEIQLRAAQTAKSELEAQLAIVQEQLKSVKNQQDSDLSEMQAQIKSVKAELLSKNQELQALKDQHDDEVKDIQRGQKQLQSQNEKQQALQEQKISFLEASIAEKNSSDMQLLTQQLIKNDELQSEIKQIAQQYESQIKELQEQLESHQDQQYNFEQKLSHSQQLLQQSELKCQDIEATLSSQLKHLQSQMQQPPKPQSQSHSTQIQSLMVQIQEQEQKFKSQQDLFHQSKHDYKKQLAMKDQQLEFLEMQLSENKELLQAAQSQHQQMLKMFKQDSPKKYQRQQVESDEMVKELEGQYEQLNQQLIGVSKEKEQLKVDQRELELSNQQLQQSHDRLQQQYQSLLDESQSTKQTLLDKLKALELQLKSQDHQFQSTKQDLDQQHQKQLDQLQAQQSQELEQQHSRYELQIKQLKDFFDSEKDKYNQKVHDEKDRHQKRLQVSEQEMELKYQEQLAALQSDLDQSQIKLERISSDYTKQLQSIQGQLDHEKQSNQSLVSQLQAYQQSQSAQDQERFKQHDLRLAQFDQYRCELQVKLDDSLSQLISKDKQIASIQNQLDRESDNNKRSIQALEEQLLHEKKQVELLSQKCEQSKRRVQELMDSSAQSKADSQQQQALLEQSNRFQAARIDELQSMHQEMLKSQDEKMRVYRAEVLQDAALQVQKMKEDKEQSDQKHEQKRLKLKDTVDQLQQQLQQQEIQKQLLSQQLLQLQSQLQEQKLQFEQQLSEMPFQFSGQQPDDIIELKSKLQDLQHQLQDCQSEHDRDKALWEGKCSFLEARKETYKNDLLDQQRGFELTLEQLQKRAQQDRDKQESAQQQLQKVLESKYKSQINQIVTAGQILQQEQAQKIKRLENELLSIQSQSKPEIKDERKLMELKQQCSQLELELDEEKKDRLQRVADLQRQLDKEKEVNKLRILESDRKLKEVEQRRASLYFQVEKERATWLVEEEQYLRRCSELQEQIQVLEKSKEQLKRENDKIKRSDSQQRFTMATTGQLLKQYDHLQTQGQGTTSSQSGLQFNKFKKPIDKKDLTLPLPQKAQSNRYKIQQHFNSTDTGEYMD